MKPNFKLRLNIKTKLFGGIATLLIISSVIAIVGISFQYDLEEKINVLTDDITPIIETADDLNNSVLLMGTISNEIMVSESLVEVDQLYGEFNTAAANFRASLAEFEQLKLSATAQEKLGSLPKLKTALRSNADAVYNYHKAELEEEIKSKALLDDFDMKGSELILMLEEFAIENEEEMRKAEELGDNLEATAGSSAAQVNAVLGELFDRDYPVVEAALKLQRMIIELQDTSGEYLAEEDPAKLPEVRANFDLIMSDTKPYLAVIEELAESDDDLQDIRTIRATIDDWKTLALADEQLFDSYRDQLDAEAQSDINIEELEDVIDNIDGILDEITTEVDAQADSADEQASMTVSRGLTMLTGVLIFSVIFGVLIGTLLIRSIITPIRALTDRLTDIAEGDGDLTARIKVDNKDEIGALASEFNSFIGKIQQMIKQISQETDGVADSIKSMSEVSNSVNEKIILQEDEVKNVVHSVEEIRVAAKQISDNAEQCVVESQRGTEEGESARKTVNYAVEAVNGLAGNIDNSSNVIKDLDNEVEKITSVLEVIRGIAEQTNLLALNAAIEAARAGEHGRGFAVVADEVRTLAARTQSSTDEIQSMIESLQRGASSAVDSINQSREGSETTVSHAEQAGDSLGKMSSVITNVNDMIEKIASASEEQREITEVVNQKATALQEVMNVTAKSTSTNKELSDKVEEATVRLRSLVEQFKV